MIDEQTRFWAEQAQAHIITIQGLTERLAAAHSELALRRRQLEEARAGDPAELRQMAAIQSDLEALKAKHAELEERHGALSDDWEQQAERLAQLEQENAQLKAGGTLEAVVPTADLRAPRMKTLKCVTCKDHFTSPHAARKYCDNCKPRI